MDNILQGDKPVLIGGGTDGAFVNVGIHSGMKTKMQEVIPCFVLGLVFFP